MKKNSIQFLLFSLALVSVALLPSISLRAQGNLNSLRMAHRQSGDAPTLSYSHSYFKAGSGEFQPLSEEVSISGADALPIFGRLEQTQTDGRGLHNIQVDPSNPNNVHAVIMEENNQDPKDTNLFGRRLMYTFSSDGGHTWTNPDTLGNTRTGFACMILYNRNGKYVPIIAAHRYLSNSTTAPVECAIWVEQGNPGDGNFAMTECGTNGVNGTADLLWPYIGINPSNDTVYILGCFDNPQSASAVDFFQFGTFTLSTEGGAKFNGWATQIGDNNDNDGSAGFVQDGDYVLRVSPKGKIGILWRQIDEATPNASLYFIESTDGGQTWPQTFNPLEVIADQGTQVNSQEVYSGPYTGLDFFYAGENAKVVWMADDQTFSTTGGSYYPAAISLHCFDVASNTDVEFQSDRGESDDSSQHNLLGALASFNNSVDTEFDSYIDYPTIARSSSPNDFAVFYQILPLNDTVLDASNRSRHYGSIYYQYTNDGGKTWSDTVAFHTNYGPAGSYGKIDFRWPQVSDWNGATADLFKPTVMYAADTAPGTVAGIGSPDWDIINFFHEQVSHALAGVSNPQLAAEVGLSNYPNPVGASTNIQFTLPEAGHALLTVTDMLGRPVQTLADEFMGAGTHSVVFSAGTLANGVYRYTLTTGDITVSRSLSLLR